MKTDNSRNDQDMVTSWPGRASGIASYQGG